MLIGILLVVGAANILTMRIIVLPRLGSAPQARQVQVMLTGYMFAVAPALHGLITVVFTGQRLFVLPFTALSLWGCYAIWGHVREGPLR